jgi:DNA adenine methylase
MSGTAARRYISPLRYPGGKARMAPFLGEMFAQQVAAMDVEIWLEPFAGGAGAGLSMLEADAVGEVWLTEKNPAIAAMWRAVLGEGEALAARVETTAPDMALWGWARETVAAAGEQEVPDLDLGFAALVINRCSRSGIVTSRVGPIGGKSQDGRWTLASRWNGAALAERIRHLATLRRSIRFTEGDAICAIADLDGSGIEDEVLAFVDPPYIREGNRLYAHGMSELDHRRLAGALNASPARWMLTYDDEPSVAEALYPQRRVLAYRISNTANRQRIATEYAVFSGNLLLPSAPELLPGADTEWVRRPATQRMRAA